MEGVAKAREAKPERNDGRKYLDLVKELRKWIKPLRLGVAPHLEAGYT